MVRCLAVVEKEKDCDSEMLSACSELASAVACHAIPFRRNRTPQPGVASTVGGFGWWWEMDGRRGWTPSPGTYELVGGGAAGRDARWGPRLGAGGAGTCI